MVTDSADVSRRVDDTAAASSERSSAFVESSTAASTGTALGVVGRLLPRSNR